MLARVSVLLLVVPYLVAATAVRRGGSTVNQCNTGTLQCCNSVQDASDPTMSSLTGLLGMVLPSIGGKVGLNCSPILALSGNNCASQPVCCSKNDFNGLINVGCTPINVNL